MKRVPGIVVMATLAVMAGPHALAEQADHGDRKVTALRADTLEGNRSMRQRDCRRNFRSTLQIIHSSDNESSFQDPNTLEEKILNYSAVVDGLHRVARRECIPTLYLTAGDHTIPGPFYDASEEAFGAPGLGDIMIYNAMNLTANGTGNHEFDGGIDEFAQMLSLAKYPFLSVNLDFGDVDLGEEIPEIRIGNDATACGDNAGKIVKSCWVSVGGRRVGIIGRAPADFFNIIEDPDTNLPGLDFFGGRDDNNQPLVSAVTQVLEQVDLLEDAGVKRIVLLDHAQDYTSDPLSAGELRGVDIIVAAGTTGFMAQPVPNGPFNLLRAEDTPEADYPTERGDSEGNTVLVVNSDQLYRYAGNLIAIFDQDGRIVGVDMRSGPVATTAEGIDALELYLNVTDVEPRQAVVDTYAMLQQTDLIQDAFFVVGETLHALNGLRADVRTRETNLGNLAADSTIWGAQQSGFASVDVALKNGGGIRDSITGPSIIRLAIQAALAFDNTLTVLELTGAQLLAAMENAVSRADTEDGRFPQVAGMVLAFDTTFAPVEAKQSISVPSRVRQLSITRHDGNVVNLVMDGVADAVALSDTFVVATNSFTASGGDGYAAFAAGLVLGETAVGEQSILEDYIVDFLGGVVDSPDTAGNPQRVIRLSE